jgi:uncharacterized glyoxalase superfamily protein PhnB
MPSLTPLLRYRDPRAAIAWLEQAFGFATHYIAEQDGQVVHAQMRFGDELIYLSPDQADDKYGMRSPLSLSGTNQCVCVALPDNVDAACERARSAGARIITEPYDTPFGSRDFVCADLEGHVWTFGTYAGEPISPHG